MSIHISRRKFIQVSAAGLASTMLPVKFMKGQAWAVANSGNLTKWIQPIRGLGPTGIPVLSSTPDLQFPNTNFYDVTVGEFSDQLHPQLGPTKLWGYWDTTNPVKAHLGGLIVARRGKASRLRFTNTLPATHIIPVDPTVMVQGTAFAPAHNRVATHLHGGYIPWVSDGGPFDWFDPAGGNGLSFPNGPGSVFDGIPGKPMKPGQADYFYPNDQSARLMWYHDHAYGITRINAYAGIATGYLLLDAVNDAYFAAGKIPGLASTIPLVFQDKIFVSATTAITDPTWVTVARPDVQSIGSLWYEHVYNPQLFKLQRKPGMLPPPNPSAIPEFFGDTMLCNGTVYPVVTVEAKRYRFFILNACNARFLNINLHQVAPQGEIATDPKTLFLNPAVNPAGPQIIQIGNEAGFLLTETTFPNNTPFNPLTLTGNLLLAPAERADIIIDFTGQTGKEFIMYNDAPGPFPVGPASNDYFLGNRQNKVQPLPNTGPDTRQILRFKVVAPAGALDPQPPGAILDPLLIDPPLPVIPTRVVKPIPPLNVPTTGPYVPATIRNLTLNEDFDGYGRLRQLLGTTVAPNPALPGFGREYLAPATETPVAGTTEVWNIYNLTADTHPIHFHLVNVQVLKRQPFVLTKGVFTLAGVARGPEPNELGWKETVQMHPAEVTTVIMRFDLPAVPFNVGQSLRTTGNEFVWHCHILEHEEHDMMRPLVVSGTNPVTPITVTPATSQLTGSVGGTANYGVNNSTGFTVASDNAAYTVAGGQIVLGPAGFAVTVPPGAPAAMVTFTITDGTGRTAATATLQIL